MARQSEHEARSQRLVSVGALALLAVTTALAFGRVFRGRIPTLKLLAAAVLSLLVAAAFERRSLLLAAVASAAVLLATVGWLVFPKTLWYGLPSKETLGAIGRALGRVGEQARVEVSPTLPLTPLMLAALTAVWTAAFSAHALANRAGSPLLAILPPVALVGFADTVLADGARPFYAITFLGAALVVVFVDGLRRIRQWGPVWAWQGKSRRVTSATFRGAQKVAVLAVAVAALVPGLLPGFRSGALVDFSTSGDAAVDLDPFVSIKALLDRKEPVDMFRVTSTDADGQPVPSYWRLFALDRFDGATLGFTSSDPEGSQGRLVYTPAVLDPTPPPGTLIARQQYQVLADLNTGWLPMAYPPETVAHPDGTLRYDEELGGVVAAGGVNAGDAYVVSSRIVAPTREQLDQIGADAIRSMPEYYRYTFLPGEVAPEVKDIAVAWAGTGTPYERVMAIQDRFTGGSFRYTTNVHPPADADPLLDFLTVSKAGFCQQFATAMAVLVRELRYPARVAVGFRQGRADGPTFTVRSTDAHSWVEVYFPGYGWLPFEPTPARPNPLEAVPGSYLSPDVTPACPEGQPGCQQTDGQSNAVGGRAAASGHVGRDPDSRGGPRRGGGRLPVIQPVDTGYHVPYGLLFLALLALLGAFLVLMPIAKALLRHRLLHRARGAREVVLATYRLFDGEASDLGLARAAGETMAEYRDRLARTVAFSDGHLERLTAAAAWAAYSNRPVTDEQAREAAHAARIAIREIRRDRGPIRRITGVYRPGL